MLAGAVAVAVEAVAEAVDEDVGKTNGFEDAADVGGANGLNGLADLLPSAFDDDADDAKTSPPKSRFFALSLLSSLSLSSLSLLSSSTLPSLQTPFARQTLTAPSLRLHEGRGHEKT